MSSSATRRRSGWDRLWGNPWFALVLSVLAPVAFFAYLVVVGSTSSGAAAGILGGSGMLFVLSILNLRSSGTRYETAEPLRLVHEAVLAEQRRRPHQRRTGACDESLRIVRQEVERADRALSYGEVAEGTRRLRALDGLTTDWAPSSQERRQALELVAYGVRLARQQDQDRWFGRLARRRRAPTA